MTRFETDDQLEKLRRDLQLRGVAFGWERRPGSGPTDPGRLVAFMRGKSADVGAFAAATFALTLVSPYYPHAVILGGGVPRSDPAAWVALVWLDAPEGEARKREEAHPDLEPRGHDPGQRCPHDGNACGGRASLVGTERTPCGDRPCAREAVGRSRPSPLPGYPLPGHTFPARPRGSR